MADQNHVVGGGGSGGQGSTGGERPNQDPAQDVGTSPTDAGEQESGAGYGNNAGVQGEDSGSTAEAHPS